MAAYCGRQSHEEHGSLSSFKTDHGTLVIGEDTVKCATMRHWHAEGEACAGKTEDAGRMWHIRDVYCWADCASSLPILVTQVEVYKTERVTLSADTASYLLNPVIRDHMFSKPNEDNTRQTDFNAEAGNDIFRDVLTTNDGVDLVLEFTVSVDAEVNFLLCDIFGRVYSTKRGSFKASEGTHVERLDISALLPGNYLVRMETSACIRVEKFTKHQ